MAWRQAPSLVQRHLFDLIFVGFICTNTDEFV
jgi:hypothetical protein